MAERKRQVYCPHCKASVSKSTFYHHKSLYYSESLDCWNSSSQNVKHYPKIQSDSELSASTDSDSSIDLDFGPPAPKIQIVSPDTVDNDNPIDDDHDNMESDDSSDDELEISEEEEEEACELWDSDTDLDDVLKSSDEHEPSGRYYCRLLAVFFLSWQYRFHLSDAAVCALLLFIKGFLSVINSVVRSDLISSIVDCLPNTVGKCRTLLGINESCFRTYVCCRKCDSLYEFQECIEKSFNGKITSRKCPHVEFPNHPRMFFRKPCDTLLLKEVRFGSKKFCYPYRKFCYKSIAESLAQLLSRTGFIERCEYWRKRQGMVDIFEDVYDGKVWHDFQSVNERDFLSRPHSFGLMMNIDWFQPFKHTNYSVGAIYMVVMNLPRAERFKPENVIICGIIPGPKESKKHINSFLSKLVLELLDLWEGVYVNIRNHPLPIRIRAALMCVASDIPATRKVCGFTGHNSTMGCSKCLKPFIIRVREPSDFSGYDRSTWPVRTKEHHMQFSRKHKDATMKQRRKELERESGVRYSVLTKLPYFDCTRFHVVDPMHNLLLGTAKHIMNVWVTNEIITRADFDKIQEIVDSFIIPNDVGRIPYRIGSGFSGFKADQWRSWTTIFSLVSLKGVLPPEHYSCWRLYVHACQILCSRTISVRSLLKADDLLTEFCISYTALYGCEKTTPNMHLHLHLKDSILDYGPVYAFWLFSYERYNGILGAVPTNNKAIEVQLMKRFICDQQLRDDSLTSELQASVTTDILSQFSVVTGSVARQVSIDEYKLIGPNIEKAFDDTELELLLSAHSKAKGERVECYRSYRKVKALIYAGHILGSVTSRLNSSTIIARHPTKGLQVAQIQYFCVHRLKSISRERVAMDTQQQSATDSVCAFVEWYEPHPEQFWFSTSVYVCCKHYYENSFIFLSDIIARAATCHKSINFVSGQENVLCAVSLEYISH